MKLHSRIAWPVHQRHGTSAHLSHASHAVLLVLQVIQPLSFLLLFAVCRRTMTALRCCSSITLVEALARRCTFVNPFDGNGLQTSISAASAQLKRASALVSAHVWQPINHLPCRNTLLRYVFPFDECISFHRLCGYLILLCSAGHTICHIGNFVDWVRCTSCHFTVPLVMVQCAQGMSAVVSSPARRACCPSRSGICSSGYVARRSAPASLMSFMKPSSYAHQVTA